MSNNGCQATISHPAIVNVQPVAKFTAVNSSVCDSVLVQFLDSSTASANTVYAVGISAMAILHQPLIPAIFMPAPAPIRLRLRLETP